MMVICVLASVVDISDVDISFGAFSFLLKFWKGKNYWCAMW